MVAPLAVSVVDVPAQIGFTGAVMLTIGIGFTWIVMFAAPEHPAEVPVTV